jgi:uncharacterized phage infection (PIP) family protein YhgE
MPETSTIIQDGVDRFREAYGSLEGEVQRVQKELRIRRKKLEKRFETGRKDIEKRFSTQRKEIEKRFEAQRKLLAKRTEKLRTGIEKNPAVKRLDALRKDATKQIEQRVSDVLGALQIASKSDLQRIDRKISQISKKLKEMDRGKRSNGSASQPTA